MNPKQQAGAELFGVQRVTPSCDEPLNRPLPIEAPVAVSFNGTAYAVMMATPLDLEDFGYGFALSERIASSIENILDVSAVESDDGWLLMVNVDDTCMATVHSRTRNRAADGSCGLCGLESLAEINRPLPKITATITTVPASIFFAVDNLKDHQPLNAQTGGVHAAAACKPDNGDILLVREDVGRHNALDKLIGALARSKQSAEKLFFLVSSRCSYELVDKTATAGSPLLVSISTATDLATKRAQACGLQLIALARSDAYLSLSKPE